MQAKYSLIQHQFKSARLEEITKTIIDPLFLRVTYSLTILFIHSWVASLGCPPIYVLDRLVQKRTLYLPDCSLLLIKLILKNFRMSDFPSEARPLYAPFFSVMGASSAMIFR